MGTKRVSPIDPFPPGNWQVWAFVEINARYGNTDTAGFATMFFFNLLE